MDMWGARSQPKLATSLRLQWLSCRQDTSYPRVMLLVVGAPAVHVICRVSGIIRSNVAGPDGRAELKKEHCSASSDSLRMCLSLIRCLLLSWWRGAPKWFHSGGKTSRGRRCEALKVTAFAPVGASVPAQLSGEIELRGGHGVWKACAQG